MFRVVKIRDKVAQPSIPVYEHQVFALYKELIEEYPTKAPYELFRGKTKKAELVIVYKPNRKQRSRNSWYENRALMLLAKQNKWIIRKNVWTYKDGLPTEIDGQPINHEEVVIEVKRQIISQRSLDFLWEKAKATGAEKLIIVASGYKKTLKCRGNIECYIFEEDHATLQQYYTTECEIPEEMTPFLSRRHHRFLLTNGHWFPQRRRYTITAKWTYKQRLLRDITHLFRRKIPPVKIYYSLSRMINPLGEFQGKGYPTDLIMTAFDVDAAHIGEHLVNEKGICPLCVKDSKEKLKRLEKRLSNLGYRFTYFFSGSKGYHVYLLNTDGNFYESPPSFLKEMTLELEGLVDNFLSKKTKLFDKHRIFKVPGTVDASTGVIVSRNFKKIKFNDFLHPTSFKK